jgi:hypothetical protein
MVIIAICGFQGVGKDTFSNYLVSNYEFKKFSFAAATKDVLTNMFGWDRNLLEGDTIESRIFRETIDSWWADKLSIPDLTPRKILQMVGTDLFRNHFNCEIWVHIVEKKIIDMLKVNPSQNIIISDCRFPNEIKMVKNLGAKLIHIQRNLPEWFEKYKRGEDCDEALKLHLSETSWIREDFDYLIENSYNNEIGEFESQIDSFIEDKFNIKINIELKNKKRLYHI